MSKIKYSVCNYTGIGENPLVILLNCEKGRFKNQFENIEDLKIHLGKNPIIYFVGIGDNENPTNRLKQKGLSSWNDGDVFDFYELDSISNNMQKRVFY